MSRDPRAELTALIAKALHDRECGCGDYDPAAGDESMPYSAQADEVMDLFEVGSERLALIDGEPYVMPGEVPATHRRYVLCTAPQPIEETPR